MTIRRQWLALILATLVMLLTGFSAAGQAPPTVPASKDDIRSATAVGGQLGPEFQISLATDPEADRYAASVAYNWRHHEYLVVWHNLWPGGHRDIYARRVSASGELLSWFAVSAGPNDRAQPAVVYNGANDEYLITWMYNVNGDGSTYEIWGRTVAWNGGYQNPEFQIITYPNRSFWSPRAAWNSYRNEYLVVWAAINTTTGLPADVAHALLDDDGTNLYGTIITSTDEPHQPDVTYNVAQDEFLVVWRRMWTAGDGDILAARISGSAGTVVDPPGYLVVNVEDEDQRSPTVTTNGQDRYLVAWEHAYPGPCCDWDIRAQLLDVNGGLVGGQFYLAATADDETVPQAAARPGPRHEYVVVWQRSTTANEIVQGWWWTDTQGAWLDVADYAFWNTEGPAVAAGCTSFLAVYEGDSQGDPTVSRHIYGRRWVPYTIHLPLVLRGW
ncbi:MAG: hypothetical protein M8467_05180 [Anaerolineae bacterium]|nr:hypothetical protein [Anaerolineae bacterium]